MNVYFLPFVDCVLYVLLPFSRNEQFPHTPTPYFSLLGNSVCSFFIKLWLWREDIKIEYDRVGWYLKLHEPFGVQKYIGSMMFTVFSCPVSQLYYRWRRTDITTHRSSTGELDDISKGSWHFSCIKLKKKLTSLHTELFRTVHQIFNEKDVSNL